MGGGERGVIIVVTNDLLCIFYRVHSCNTWIAISREKRNVRHPFSLPDLFDFLFLNFLSQIFFDLLSSSIIRLLILRQPVEFFFFFYFLTFVFLASNLIRSRNWNDINWSLNQSLNRKTILSFIFIYNYLVNNFSLERVLSAMNLELGIYLFSGKFQRYKIEGVLK